VYNEAKLSGGKEKWKRKTDLSWSTPTMSAIITPAVSGLWTKKWMPATAATTMMTRIAPAAARRTTSNKKANPAEKTAGFAFLLLILLQIFAYGAVHLPGEVGVELKVAKAAEPVGVGTQTRLVSEHVLKLGLAHVPVSVFVDDVLRAAALRLFALPLFTDRAYYRTIAAFVSYTAGNYIHYYKSKHMHRRLINLFQIIKISLI